MNMGDNIGKDSMERVELLQDIFASVLTSKVWSQSPDSHQNVSGRRKIVREQVVRKNSDMLDEFKL